MSGPGRFTTAINEMGLTTPLSVAAAGFAGAGVPVFPCAPGGKHPITEHGFHDATTNLAQVRQWWRRFPQANIGVPTGRPSGVVVVDVDVHGVNGFAACCRAKEAGLLSGWEVVVRSPSGGLHAYYPAHESAEQRSWQAGRAGIDFRGDGGYIIAPPSRRAVNGELALYQVTAVSEAPGKALDATRLRDFLDPPRLPRPRSYRGNGELDVRRIAEWVARRPENERNHGLFWGACKLAERGVAQAEASDVLTRAAMTAGLGEREAARTVRSAYRTVNDGHVSSGIAAVGTDEFAVSAADSRAAIVRGLP